MELKVDPQRVGGWAVLHLTGEIDLATAPTLREHLVGTVDAGDHRVIVDLRDVEFIDSTGLGALIGGLKRVRSLDGALRLICVEPRILKIFEITGLDKVFEIHADVEGAAAS